MRGYLWMKNKKKLLNRGNWSTHWFILRNQALLYYPDEGNESAEFMEGCFDVQQMVSINLEANSSTEVLKIMTVQNQSLSLRGKSNEETRAWKEHLMKAKSGNLEEINPNEVKMLRRNLLELTSIPSMDNGLLLSKRHSRSMSSLPMNTPGKFPVPNTDRHSQMCMALLSPSRRDSYFWSDVSSIGPSVSAAGSVNEDELDQASGNRKGSDTSTPNGSSKLSRRGTMSSRIRTPQIPLHGRQLPLYHEIMEQNQEKIVSSEQLPKTDPSNFIRELTFNDLDLQSSDPPEKTYFVHPPKKNEDKSKDKSSKNKSSDNEGSPPTLRRNFLGRASLPKLKRSSKTFMSRFRKISAPNKQEPKSRKSLKVQVSSKRLSYSPRISKELKDSFPEVISSPTKIISTPEIQTPLTEDDLDFYPSFEKRVSMRTSKLEKSGSNELDEKKMLGILHLLEHPESLQQHTKDETRASVTGDNELMTKLQKWKESADTGNRIRSSWRPFGSYVGKEFDENPRKAVRTWTSFVSPNEMLIPAPSIPPKSLQFKKQQLEHILEGKLKPRERIDLKEVSILLDRLVLEYRAQFFTLKKNRDTSVIYDNYDYPRKLDQPHFYEEEEGVQLRHRSVIY